MPTSPAPLFFCADAVILEMVEPGRVKLSLDCLRHAHTACAHVRRSLTCFVPNSLYMHFYTPRVLASPCPCLPLWRAPCWWAGSALACSCTPHLFYLLTGGGVPPAASVRLVCAPPARILPGAPAYHGMQDPRQAPAGGSPTPPRSRPAATLPRPPVTPPLHGRGHGGGRHQGPLSLSLG